MKCRLRSLSRVCVATIALASVRGGAQGLSPSKLSAHLINNYTAGSSNIVAGHPRTLKVLGLDSGFPSGMAQAMRDYKGQVPGGKIVVRIYSPKSYSLADGASASAGDFWTNILQRGVNYLTPSDRGLIDYLEGPNEGQTPTLGYPDPPVRVNHRAALGDRTADHLAAHDRRRLLDHFVQAQLLERGGRGGRQSQRQEQDWQKAAHSSFQSLRCIPRAISFQS